MRFPGKHYVPSSNSGGFGLTSFQRDLLNVVQGAQVKDSIIVSLMLHMNFE